jgi:hypothetical protein
MAWRKEERMVCANTPSDIQGGLASGYTFIVRNAAKDLSAAVDSDVIRRRIGFANT